MSCERREGSEAGGETRQKAQDGSVCDGGKDGAPDSLNSPKPPQFTRGAVARFGGNSGIFGGWDAREELGALGPRFCPKLPQKHPPPPPQFRREGCEKGPIVDNVAKRSAFTPNGG